MVHAGKPEIPTRISGIAASKVGAQAFVRCLVMQTIFDVLENQGRSAILPDALISTILSQLTVSITYEPVQCQNVVLDLVMNKIPMMESGCIIAGNTVTVICINNTK
ncbi:hypothetical protein KIN20_035369 [Parelaphostrongylus tenuis]|uniref:Uncharacterized protein n=1 Tax=Parelaphostrongylus tenuis TaxID=148309 RepID=A0AAD5WKE0_PARTN|nr:hypothetical protein KIN20_035369 [Parelaphostrongylus tenuis]